MKWRETGGEWGGIKEGRGQKAGAHERMNSESEKKEEEEEGKWSSLYL